MTQTGEGQLARAIKQTFMSPNENDSNYEAANVVDGLYSVARALHALGNGNAATHMGGMEALGKAVLDSSEQIASAMGGIADAISDLADAIRESKAK